MDALLLWLKLCPLAALACTRPPTVPSHTAPAYTYTEGQIDAFHGLLGWRTPAFILPIKFSRDLLL